MLETLERLLGHSTEADDVLRATVELLVAEPGIVWAGIAFLEEGSLVLGPAAGSEDLSRRVHAPIVYRDEPVGELWVDGDSELALIGRVAELVAPHVLVGWDTGGERWEA